MEKKTKIWIIVLAAVTVLSCGGYFILKTTAGAGSIADIYVDGQLYKKVNIADVSEPYDIEITTEFGSNTVHVDKGCICVTDADCPDHICIASGKLYQSGMSIICMPHRLVITVEGGKIDAQN